MGGVVCLRNILSPEEASHLMSNSQQAIFHGEELLAPRQTPKLEVHPSRLSAAAYSICSQLPSISEAVPPSAT
jgi:hypothetical protein